MQPLHKAADKVKDLDTHLFLSMSIGLLLVDNIDCYVQGDLDEVKRLVEVEGADVNLPSKLKRTALHYAALCPNVAIVKVSCSDTRLTSSNISLSQYLLDHGAEIDATDACTHFVLILKRLLEET